MKSQFAATEDLVVACPPFINKTTGAEILGTDSVSVIVKDPNNTVWAEPTFALWDEDVGLWVLTVDFNEYIQGAWKFRFVSDDENVMRPYRKVIVWGDYVSNLDSTISSRSTTTDVTSARDSIKGAGLPDIAAVKAKTDLIPQPYYRMRGFDVTLSETVYWDAPVVDPAGAYYGGPGPLTGVVLV